MCLLLWFFLLGCSPVDDGMDATFHRSNKAVLDRDYDQAIQGYLKLLEQRPSGEINHNLGIAYYLHGEAGLAVLHLERAERLRWNAADTREVLSVVRQAEGLDEPVPGALERFAMAMPESFWALVWVAGVWGGLASWYAFRQRGGKRRSAWRDAAVMGVLCFGVAGVAAWGWVEDAQRVVMTHVEEVLRVTPTPEGEAFRPVRRGEVLRCLRRREAFVYVETHEGIRGWMPGEAITWIR
jgi:hypothetical protein